MRSVQEVIGRIRRCGLPAPVYRPLGYENKIRNPDTHEWFPTHKSVKLDDSDIDGLKLARINYLSVYVVSDPSISNEIEISSHDGASRGKTD